MTVSRAIKRVPPLSLPETAPADASAIKALNRGDATPEQQRRALDWIIKKACLIGTLPFDLDSDRVSNLNMGRQFVGLQILHVVTEPMEAFQPTPRRSK